MAFFGRHLWVNILQFVPLAANPDTGSKHPCAPTSSSRIPVSLQLPRAKEGVAAHHTGLVVVVEMGFKTLRWLSLHLRGFGFPNPTHWDIIRRDEAWTLRVDNSSPMFSRISRISCHELVGAKMGWVGWIRGSGAPITMSPSSAGRWFSRWRTWGGSDMGDKGDKGDSIGDLTPEELQILKHIYISIFYI